MQGGVASVLCRCFGLFTLVRSLAWALCEGFSSPHRNPDSLSPHDSQELTTQLRLCGIDHEALNKQIMEYKRKKEKGLPRMSLAPPSGGELAPELMHSLKRKKAPSRKHQDMSPRSFLLGEEDEDEFGTTEYEFQTHEGGEEWEIEAGGNRVQPGLYGEKEQG